MHRYLLVLGLVGGALLACDGSAPPPSSTPGVQLGAAVGGDLSHRKGVDQDSVLGCLAGCVDMKAGLAAMTNPKTISKQRLKLAEKQDQCLGMFTALDERAQAYVYEHGLDPLRQCLDERVPCLASCTELGVQLQMLCGIGIPFTLCDIPVATLVDGCYATICGHFGACEASCGTWATAVVGPCDPTTGGPLCGVLPDLIGDACDQMICPLTCGERCEQTFGAAWSTCQQATDFEAACFVDALDAKASCDSTCCLAECPGCEGCEPAPVPVCGDGRCEARETEYCGDDCAQACEMLCSRDAQAAYAACYERYPDYGPELWACYEEVGASISRCYTGCARCGDGYCSGGEGADCMQDCPWACNDLCYSDADSQWWACWGAEPFATACFEGVLGARSACLVGCCEAGAPVPGGECYAEPLPSCGNGMCEAYEGDYCAADCGPWTCENVCRYTHEGDFRACDAEADIEACRRTVQEDLDACVAGCAVCGDGYCSGSEGEACMQDCPWACDNRCETQAQEGAFACWSADVFAVSCLDAVYAARNLCVEGCCDLRCPDCGDACNAQPGPVCGNGLCEAYESEYCGADCGPWACNNACYRRSDVAMRNCDGAPDPVLCRQAVEEGLVACNAGCDVCGDGYCTGTEPSTCAKDCPWVCGEGCKNDWWAAWTACQSVSPPDPSCFEATYHPRFACEYACCQATEPPDPGMCVLQPDPVCGDGACEPWEFEYCRADCPNGGCGDGVCSPDEVGWCADCPAGGCGDGVCAPDEMGWCADCGAVSSCQTCFDAFAPRLDACEGYPRGTAERERCFLDVERDFDLKCYATCCYEQAGCGADPATCPVDCQALPPASICGDGVCTMFEPSYCAAPECQALPLP